MAESKGSKESKTVDEKSNQEERTAIQTLAEQSSEFKELFDAVTLAVTAGAALLETAKPLVEGIDFKGVQEKAQTLTGAVSEGAKTVKSGVSSVGNTIGSKASDINAVREKILSDMSNAKDEKALRRAVKESRQAVLENPTTSMAVREFVASAESDAAVSGCDMPGCYVIATYKKLDFDKDLTDYTGLYLGKAKSVGKSVLEVVSKRGNADVYADYKFKQNMRIYIYNCLPEDLDNRYQSLRQLFDGQELYNLD